MQIFCKKTLIFHYFFVPLQRFLIYDPDKMTKWHESELVRNSAKLLSANVLAQVIGIVVYPVLTRLYTAEDFGLLNLFFSIGGVLAILSTAEYQYAIVLPKDDRKAAAVRLVGAILFCVVTALVFVSVAFSSEIGELFGAPELSRVYAWMPLFVLFSGMWVLLNYTYTREKQFGRISAYQMIQSVVSVGMKIVLGMADWATGLIVGSVVAPSIALVAVVTYKKRELPYVMLNLSRAELVNAAREYRKFPMYSLPRALVNSLSGNLPAFVLTPVFGLTELGYFGMAMTLAFRPLNTISTSLYQTFYQRTAEAVNARQSIMPFFKKFIGRTLAVAFPCMALLYVILPWLTEWLLGAGWEQTGELIRVMLPWLLLSVLVAPICYISDVFNRQGTSLVFEILFLLARLAGLGVGIWMDSFYVAIVGYAIGGAIVIFCQLMWLMSLVRRYERTLVDFL